MMEYSSGDAALLAGINRDRLNRMLARRGVDGGVKLGNLYGPAGKHRHYDHVEIVILALAAAVSDGLPGLAGPPMADLIEAINEHLRHAIADLFVPEVSRILTKHDMSNAGQFASKIQDQVRGEERSKFWTDRGADFWCALVFDISAVFGMSLWGPFHGSLAQIAFQLQKAERDGVRLHHVLSFNLHIVLESVAKRADEHGIKFPLSRVRYSEDMTNA